MKDYTAMSEEKQQGYINRYAGKAKYTMYEDEKKIVLKRTTKNILYYIMRYLGGGAIAWLYMACIIRWYNGGLFLQIAVLILWMSYLIFGRIPHLFRLKIEILKDERYLIVTREWKKPAKIPLDRSDLSVQKLVTKFFGNVYQYGVVYNSEFVFFMLENRPEFKRFIEYLETIGYTLVDKHWKRREDT